MEQGVKVDSELVLPEIKSLKMVVTQVLVNKVK